MLALTKSAGGTSIAKAKSVAETAGPGVIVVIPSPVGVGGVRSEGPWACMGSPSIKIKLKTAKS